MTCVTNTMKSGWRLESKFCSKLQIITPPQRIRPCDLQKLLNSLKLKKACGIDGIPNECLGQLPRRPLHSAVTFPYILEGSKSSSLTETR
jgi:hypothetical protein